MKWSLATVVLAPRGVVAHASADERRRIVDWTVRAGFTGIEVSPNWLNIDNEPTSELMEFRREAAQAGVEISGLNINRCLFTRGPRAAESLVRTRRAIDVAAILETPLVTYSLSLPLDAPGRPVLRGCDVAPADRNQAAEVLGELANLASRQDIDLSLELHDDGMLDTADFCLDMVRRIGAPNVGVNPDLGNLVRSSPNADWKTALRSLAPYTNNWHVKNYRNAQPSPVWDGEIDYAAAFEIMHSAGYHGWVSIESYFGDDVLGLQSQSLTYLKQLDVSNAPPIA
jgi:sugar phosphate isomerase/epimerase